MEPGSLLWNFGPQLRSTWSDGVPQLPSEEWRSPIWSMLGVMYDDNQAAALMVQEADFGEISSRWWSCLNVGGWQWKDREDVLVRQRFCGWVDSFFKMMDWYGLVIFHQDVSCRWWWFFDALCWWWLKNGMWWMDWYGTICCDGWPRFLPLLAKTSKTGVVLEQCMVGWGSVAMVVPASNVDDDILLQC